MLYYIYYVIIMLYILYILCYLRSGPALPKWSTCNSKRSVSADTQSKRRQARHLNLITLPGSHSIGLATLNVPAILQYPQH